MLRVLWMTCAIALGGYGASALEASSAGAAGGDEVKVKVPNQPVEVSLEVPGFAAVKTSNERTLLIGKMSGGASISVLCEENFPFLSGADCAKRSEKASGYESFTVGAVTCCRYENNIRDVGVQTVWHAWPTTPEYLFDIHVTTTVTKNGVKTGTFVKNDLIKLVKSWRVGGVSDRSSLRLPPEVYAFRDEAASAGADQL